METPKLDTDPFYQEHTFPFVNLINCDEEYHNYFYAYVLGVIAKFSMQPSQLEKEPALEGEPNSSSS